jgi:hypothetical protein
MDTLAEVFQQVFEDPGITLKAETTADDVEGWDSLSREPDHGGREQIQYPLTKDQL